MHPLGSQIVHCIFVIVYLFCEVLMFLSFEGCEGVGKSTQIELLKNYLSDTGQNALFFREPGGTDISEKIRNIILDINNSELANETEALLYAACRTQLLHEHIIPAIRANKLIFCDRYIDSSLAYQGYARKLGLDFVKKINSYAMQYIPEYTIFIDLQPGTSFRKIKTQDRVEQEGIDFHMAVYNGFLEIAKNDPRRFVMIKPEDNKFDTSKKIIKELRDRNIIK